MLRKLGRVLNRLEEYALSVMLLQMGLSMFVQVVMRYVFRSAITWLDELVHIEVVLLTFFGASLGIKYGSHICLELLHKFARGRLGRIIGVVNHLAVAAYAGVVIYYGVGLIDMMQARPHFTPTLRIPKHYLYVVVCVALALIGLRSLARAGQDLVRVVRLSREPTPP